MTGTTYLDISETVTPEEYSRVLNSLLEQFEQWRLDRGWCTDLYQYVGQLTRTFHWNPDARGVYSGYDGEMTVQYPGDRTGEEMAQDLREIRGRILRFTVDMSDTLSVAKADEFLVTAGLAPHARPENFQVDFEFSGRLTTKLTETGIREKAEEFLKSLGTDLSSYNPWTSTRSTDRVSPDEMTPLL